jgi:hypothetical protein
LVRASAVLVKRWRMAHHQLFLTERLVEALPVEE